MKNAIIIGASSGIGRELAVQLSEKGYSLCIAARRTDLLTELLKELPNEAFTEKTDITDTKKTIIQFHNIVEKMGIIDLVIICAGTGYIDSNMPWENDEKTIAVNVKGFTAIANTAYHLFKRQGHGHLVGISSLAAIRGGTCAAYNASKAYVSSYLEGLRAKAVKDKLPITISDIRPGFVNTAMAQGEGLFWVAPPSKAVKQIITALQSRKKIAYITRRWRLIAVLLKILPDKLYHKIA